MVDYKAIADDDPGGDVELAFSAMKAMTVSLKPERLLTYKTIAKEVGFAQSFQLELAVKGAEQASKLPSWVDSSLNQGGIDVNNPQTGPLLESLVGAEVAANIVAVGLSVSPKYPNLKLGHLTNARQKRAEGLI